MRTLAFASVLFAALPAFAGSAVPSSGPAVCAPPPSSEALRRFTALPGALDRWAARGCYPPRLTDDDLERERSVDRVFVVVNGRTVLVTNPPREWSRECEPDRRTLAPPLRTRGRDLLRLRHRIESSPSLRDRDLLEIGFARTRAADGSFLYAIHLATRERAARLQCYADFEAAVDQAGALFRRDERAIAQLYDFLHVERGSESLSPDPTAPSAP